MTSLSAEVMLSWAGSKYLFALKGKQIENLENDLNEGIGKICMRVFSRSDFTYRHITRSVYWGLIGGGMSPHEAAGLVKQYVEDCPIDPTNDPSSPLKTATAILKAAHFGWEALPDIVGEAGAPETPAPKQTLDSTEPPSSATE